MNEIKPLEQVPQRTTLEDAEYQVQWLLRYYDVLPPSFDPHITDAVIACKKLITEIKGIAADFEEYRPNAFTCGRIPGRT